MTDADTVEMEGWRPISTLSIDGRVMGQAPCTKVDLFSAKSNIRWPDCGWSERDGLWISQRKWFDDQGRRTTSFWEVAEPTHWMPAPLPPRQ